MNQKKAKTSQGYSVSFLDCACAIVIKKLIPARKPRCKGGRSSPDYDPRALRASLRCFYRPIYALRAHECAGS